MIHKRNLQKLAMVMFKVNNELSVQLVMKIFILGRIIVRHQSGIKFKFDHVKTETYGKQSVSCFEPKIWISIPQKIKNVTTLAAFKIKIKPWKLICPCRICRIYMQRVGFMCYLVIFIYIYIYIQCYIINYIYYIYIYIIIKYII